MRERVKNPKRVRNTSGSSGSSGYNGNTELQNVVRRRRRKITVSKTRNAQHVNAPAAYNTTRPLVTKNEERQILIAQRQKRFGNAVSRISEYGHRPSVSSDHLLPSMNTSAEQTVINNRNFNKTQPSKTNFNHLLGGKKKKKSKKKKTTKAYKAAEKQENKARKEIKKLKSERAKLKKKIKVAEKKKKAATTKRKKVSKK